MISAGQALAQSGGPGFSFDPDDRVRAGAGLDSISPYSGALSLAIPIGPVYQVGPGLSFQLRLYYSSRVWAPGLWQLWPINCGSGGTCTPEPNMLLDGDPALGLGWRLGFGSIVEGAAGVPAAYIAPDGSAHRLYNRRFFCSNGCPAPDGFFYTRDGSYVRVQYLGSTSGYKMWTPDGNATTFAQNVKGYDDAPTHYVTDFGRGRDGWHATRIENPYGDAITITYQSSGPNTPYAWVPYHVTIPSINGTGARDIWINISGSHIDNIQLPTFGGVASTYTLHHRQSPWQLFRPFPHPTAYVTEVWYLDQIDVPLGYSYSFAYFENTFSPPQTVYANGAMSSQTTPTGARIDYSYGTWTWYHANPLNRPGPSISQCFYPPPFYPPNRPTLKTGPNIEPNLTHPGLDCGAADRAAGVVQRSVNYTTLTSSDTAATKYFQYDYPNGESLTDTSAQSQTLVLSPTDAANSQHSTTHLFSVSTDKAISGPLVGALLRMALYSGDQSILGLSIPDTSSALRVQRLSYGTDPYDTNPVSASSEAFEANRRVTQSVTIFSGIPPTSPPTGKYHQIDYVFNATAGRYQSESHSGTVGGDSRYAQTDWTPDTTNWKLDRPATQHLRATPISPDFSTVTNSFDPHGFIISSVTTDGAGGYGTLTHSVSPDTVHGFPTSETFSNSAGTYTRSPLTFVAGTLATAKWNGFSWYAANNQIDSSTGLVSTSTDPAGLSTSFTYDALGRPLTTMPPGGDADTKITYVDPTHTTIRTPSSGNPEYAWSQTTTDSLGRPIKVQQKMVGGAISKKITRYDRQGRAVFESEWVDDAVSDSSPPGTSLTNFDHFGRPTTITKADGKTTTVSYADGASYPNSVWFKKVTVAGVGGGDAVTQYTSDTFGNLIKVRETPDGVANWDTTYTYNPQDRLIGVSQGGGTQTRSYLYDAFGFLRRENFPEKRNQAVTYGSYDALGNVLTETQPGGLTITRTYDTAGRLKSVAAGGLTYLTNDYDGQVACVPGPDGCPNGGADGVGKLTRQTGYNPLAPAPVPPAVVKQDFFYDDRAGRLSSRETRVYNGATFLFDTQTDRWTYDLAGELVQYDHPRASGLFSVETSYDHGFPTAVRANGLPVVVSATYQPSGLLASYVTGNDTGHNVRTDIGADPNSMARPRSFTTSGPPQNFVSGDYSYDGAGNITSIGTGATADTFGYDRLSRLTSASYFGLGSQGFSYDQYANLTGTSGVNPRAYTIDNRYNQLTLSGSDPVTYDARGNLSQIGSGTPPKEKYTWDSLDRTVGYQTAAGANWKYIYNGASERLLKIPASGLGSDYVWTFRDEANRVATEYLGPTLSRDNVYFGNLLVGSYSSCPVNGPPGWTFYSSDHLGSPRLVTDAAGNTLDLRKYWPYGDEASGAGLAAQRLRFASMERDTEGNRYYDHARSYEFQSAGRFLGVDAFGGTPAVPQSLNRYSYGLANPLVNSDPTGLDINLDVVFMADQAVVLTGRFDNGELFLGNDRFATPTGTPCCANHAPAYPTQAVTTVWNTLGRFVDSFSFSLAEPFLQILTAGNDVGQLGKGFLGVGLEVLPGAALKSLTVARAALTTIRAPLYTVYRSVNVAGQVQYVGITIDYLRRSAEHAGRFTIEPIISSLTEFEARGVEQALIKEYGLGRLGGSLLNRINSIARSNPIYDAAVARGKEILKAIGYFGD
jgi:RHS repeat-associated protein